MTAAPGPDLDYRVSWRQACRPVRLYAHRPGRLAAMPLGTRASSSEDEFRLFEDPPSAQVPLPNQNAIAPG